MSYFAEIAARLSALSGSATAKVVRQELAEFDVRDVQAVTVSQGGGNGGSVPVNQPVQDGGDTFHGTPGSSTSAAWTGNYPGGVFGGVADKLMMAPVLITEPITITEVELTLGQAGAGTTNLRVAISAADDEWQPTGDVIYQGTGSFPNTGVEFDEIELSGLAVPLEPGLYLFGWEQDQPDLSLNCRPASFPGGTFCGGGPPSRVLNNFIAPHVYGAFVGALPAWDDVSIYADEDPAMWLMPFVCKWTNGIAP